MFLTAFMAFFAIMNPIANLPVFLSLVSAESPRTQNRIALRSLLIAFGIIVVFALAGKLIFEVFGITLPALRIAGGIVLFLIGFHMLNGKSSSVHHTEQTASLAARKSVQPPQTSNDQALSLAVSPLAMPLLAGPGTIATAINLSASHGLWGIIFTILAFALMCAITYLCFRSGSKIIKFLGQSSMEIITRLMGLILAVIAVQMIIAGIQSAFPVLHG